MCDLKAHLLFAEGDRLARAGEALGAGWEGLGAGACAGGGAEVEDDDPAGVDLEERVEGRAVGEPEGARRLAADADDLFGLDGEREQLLPVLGEDQQVGVNARRVGPEFRG